jgi:hypothetical protein
MVEHRSFLPNLPLALHALLSHRVHCGYIRGAVVTLPVSRGLERIVSIAVRLRVSPLAHPAWTAGHANGSIRKRCWRCCRRPEHGIRAVLSLVCVASWWRGNSRSRTTLSRLASDRESAAVRLTLGSSTTDPERELSVSGRKGVVGPCLLEAGTTWRRAFLSR